MEYTHRKHGVWSLCVVCIQRWNHKKLFEVRIQSDLWFRFHCGAASVYVIHVCECICRLYLAAVCGNTTHVSAHVNHPCDRAND